MARKPATVTRTAAKIEIVMHFTKETPGTFRFDAADPDAPITNVYVKKAGMPDGAPKSITVIAQ